MPTRNIWYVIKPSQNLLELLKDYPRIDWGRLEIKAIPGTSNLFPEKESFYDDIIKLIFLISIVSKVRNPKLTKHNPSLTDIAEVIFGKPQQYSIEKLNKWWTFEQAHLGFSYETIVEIATIDDLEQIQIPDNQLVNNWFSTLIRNSKKE